MGDALDSQQVEILGTAALTAQLVGDGLEVGHPERDKGIDLLVFTIDPWHVVPVQLKVASGQSFSVHRKYEGIPNLLMVYVWNAGDAEAVEFLAMYWTRAKQLAEEFNWTTTASWNKEKSPGVLDKAAGYGTRYVSRDKADALKPFKMRPGLWRPLVEESRPGTP